MHDVSHNSIPNPRRSTGVATSTVTSPERTFASLWALSGAPALVGFEASLLATLARTDVPMYERLTEVDLDDPAAVHEAVEVIHNWRHDVAAGIRSISFGRRARTRAKSRAVDLTQLPQSA